MKYTYIGLRIMEMGDSVAQCFLNEKGKEAYWRGIKYLMIGGVYEVKNRQMAIRPKILTHVDDIKQEWIDSDTAALELLKRKREATKARNKAVKYWDCSLGELHARCNKLSFFEKRAFADAVAAIVVKGKP